MRRLLHIPALDARVGDTINFNSELIGVLLRGDAVITKMQFIHNPVDELYFDFEPHHYSGYYKVIDQLILVQEVE